jgi:hypothetical protein
MKKGHKIFNSGSRKAFNSIKFRTTVGEIKFEEYQRVVKAMNMLRCQEVVEEPSGHSLPNNLGKLIILGNKPRVKVVYSMTQPGTVIHNLHSFGIIYRCMHKSRDLMRYPQLYKWRSHRENIKKPMHNNIVNELKQYYKHTEFYDR